MRRVICLFLLLSLAVWGCEPAVTGRAVRNVQQGSGVLPTCSIGTELRVSEINGLSGTCYNKNLDTIEVAVEALDRDIVGLVIEVVGVNDSINITHYPNKDSVVMKYTVSGASKMVGKVTGLTVFPVAKVDGDDVVCDSHPLKVYLDAC